MKNVLLRIVASIFSLFLLTSACGAGGHSTTLKSKDVPYLATIALQDAGHDTDGKRLIAYRVNLASDKCRSVITGEAKFFATTDNMQDDSAFLPNGDVVKTNIFKSSGKNGEVTITMDIESRQPQYASVLINDRPDAGDGCFKTNEVSYDFFNW
jgi:hypothetical protein